MSRLGFFSHTSKVPGKERPSDRVKLEGFVGMGVSENIAISGGAQSAHNAWIHSSGHHRNILTKAWRVLGVGNAGRYWCQNFSGGERAPSVPRRTDPTPDDEGR